MTSLQNKINQGCKNYNFIKNTNKNFQLNKSSMTTNLKSTKKEVKNTVKFQDHKKLH